MSKFLIKLKSFMEPLVVEDCDNIPSIKNEDSICIRSFGALCRKGLKDYCFSVTGVYKNGCPKNNSVCYNSYNFVKNLEMGDFIGYPINNNKSKTDDFIKHIELYSNWVFENNFIYVKYDVRRKKIFTNFNIDENFLELCGWYVSEGCSSKERKTSTGIYNGGSVRFTLNENETKYASSIINSIKRIGLNYKIYYKGDHSMDVATSSVVLSKFLGDSFGRGAKNKKIPEWIKNLDINSLKYFLKGVILGDGCSSRRRLVYASASNTLIKDLFEILLKFGCVSNTTKYFNRGIINVRDENGHRLIMGEKKHPMYRLDCVVSQCRDLFNFLGYIISDKNMIGAKFVLDKNFVYFRIENKLKVQ